MIKSLHQYPDKNFRFGILPEGYPDKSWQDWVQTHVVVPRPQLSSWCRFPNHYTMDVVKFIGIGILCRVICIVLVRVYHSTQPLQSLHWRVLETKPGRLMILNTSSRQSQNWHNFCIESYGFDLNAATSLKHPWEQKWKKFWGFGDFY